MVVAPLEDALSRPENYSMPSRFLRAAIRMGFFQGQTMYWWWSSEINFGDWVGPLIFEWRTGRKPKYQHYSSPGRNSYLVSAGSVIAFGHRPNRAVVWGAGTHSPKKDFARPREILAVRGELTRSACLRQGYSCPEVYGDPGILLPNALDLQRSGSDFALGVVLHYIDRDRIRHLIPESQEVLLIDVRRSVQEVCVDIARCEHIISSSLHGLVVAHALGIPAGWLEITDDLPDKNFKYHDYYSAYGFGSEVMPLHISNLVTVNDMCSAARKMPLPDTGATREKLLRACPF